VFPSGRLADALEEVKDEYHTNIFENDKFSVVVTVSNGRRKFMVAVASVVMFYSLMNFSIVILEVLWDLTMEEYGTDDVQG
jgi:hypothetical protein